MPFSKYIKSTPFSFSIYSSAILFSYLTNNNKYFSHYFGISLNEFHNSSATHHHRPRLAIVDDNHPSKTTNVTKSTKSLQHRPCHSSSSFISSSTSSSSPSLISSTSSFFQSIFSHKLFTFPCTPIYKAYCSSADEVDDDDFDESQFNDLMKNPLFIKFSEFASFECDQEYFMTPKDFIKCILHFGVKEKESHDRNKKYIYVSGKHRITSKQYEKILNKTPNLNEKNIQFFRQLGDDGLLSFFDYIFLLTVLVKPKKSFIVAFKTFDRNNDDSIDLTEYIQYNRTIFGWIQKKKVSTSMEEDKQDYQKRTTLSTLFFGKDGKGELTLERLNRFMETLQTEMLEIEFLQVSKNTKSISSIELAEMLLRRFNATNGQTIEMLRKVNANDEIGEFTFEDYKSCVNLLKSLDDFRMAIRMFLMGGRRISKDEFQRACRAVTGSQLQSNVLNILFLMFHSDSSPDHLDHHDFFRHFGKNWHYIAFPTNRFVSFQKCMHMELK